MSALAIALASWASAGCAEEATTCLDYHCTSSATLRANFTARVDGEFEYSFCHGDDCRNGLVGPLDATETCSSANPHTVSDSVSVCLFGANVLYQRLGVDGHWIFDREGTPNEKAFRLTLIERSSGEIVLEQAATGEFSESLRFDECHDCRHAEMNFRTAEGL